MLCKHCGSTWNDTYVFDKCPVCGTVFETAKKPFTDAACLISQLIEKYDAEILLDHNRLSAYMMDLLEGNQQEKKLIVKGIKTGVTKKIYEMMMTDHPEERTGMIGQIKSYLIEEEFIAEKSADRIVKILLVGAGMDEPVQNSYSADNSAETRFSKEKEDRSTDTEEINDFHSVHIRHETTVSGKKKTQIPLSKWTDIISVSVGSGHVVGLRSDGTVVACGNNYDNQCSVENWSEIMAISAGDFHTVGLRRDGTVVAVGQNEIFGQCETSRWKDIVSLSAGGFFSAGLRRDGTVAVTLAEIKRRWKLSNPDSAHFKMISSGINYTAGILSDNTLVGLDPFVPTDYRFGFTDYQFVTNDYRKKYLRHLQSISAGGFHMACIRLCDNLVDIQVIAFGDNKFGQCNVDGWKEVISLSTGIYTTVGLRKDGTVLATGDNRFGQCNVSAWKDIKAIAAGDWITVGVKQDGTVVATSKM